MSLLNGHFCVMGIEVRVSRGVPASVGGGGAATLGHMLGLLSCLVAPFPTSVVRNLNNGLELVLDMCQYTYSAFVRK